MKSFFQSILKMILFFVFLFAGLGFLIDKSGCSRAFEVSFEDSHFGTSDKVKDKSFLVLDLEGVIMDGKDFLEDLKHYSEKEQVVAIIVRVNSPGGVVGPSQEIYSELKRVRDGLKKPVIMAFNGVAASGAYYAAMGASHIFTNPGTLMGSIGVIMEFADMQGLYEWAKVKPYAITSGKLKNAGAAYKTMDEVERKYFQDLIDETYQQFVTVVKTERKLDDEIVTNYTDGRVFNGRTGVKLGFADSEGTYNDAIELAKELTKVDGKPNLIIPSNRKKRLLEILTESRFISGLIDGRILQNKMQLMGKPLYLMPGAIKF